MRRRATPRPGLEASVVTGRGDRSLRARGGFARGLVLAEKRTELGRDLRDRLRADRKTAIALPNDDVLRPPPRISFGEVVARVAAAALLADECAPRDRFGDADEILEVERKVPAGVVDTRAGDARPRGARPQTLEARECFLELVAPSDDA